MLNEVEHSQYRNAVASGRCSGYSASIETDLTLPRYGTDCVPLKDQHHV